MKEFLIATAIDLALVAFGVLIGFGFGYASACIRLAVERSQP